MSDDLCFWKISVDIRVAACWRQRILQLIVMSTLQGGAGFNVHRAREAELRCAWTPVIACWWLSRSNAEQSSYFDVLLAPMYASEPPLTDKTMRMKLEHMDGGARRRWNYCAARMYLLRRSMERRFCHFLWTYLEFSILIRLADASRVQFAFLFQHG